MIIDREKSDKEKITEERKHKSEGFYKDAERIDDRWNWYVLTIPFAAIAFSLQMSVSEDIWVVITHIVSLVSLSTACIFGILSQRESSKALKNHALGCMFSIGSETAEQEIKEWMEKGVNMLIEKEGKSCKKKLRYKVVQYWATSIGLLLLFVQHVLSLEICQYFCNG